MFIFASSCVLMNYWYNLQQEFHVFVRWCNMCVVFNWGAGVLGAHLYLQVCASQPATCRQHSVSHYIFIPSVVKILRVKSKS